MKRGPSSTTHRGHRPLTSIRADLDAIAQFSGDAVLRQEAGQRVEPLDRYVDFAPVERASTIGR